MTEEVPMEMNLISGKISSLREAILEKSPRYETLLIEIHRTLSKNPNLSIMLSDEQVGEIVKALAKKKDIEIVTALSRTTKATKVKLTEENAEDLLT
jgi:hypothetical protein